MINAPIANEVDTLNRLEKKALKKKATDRELRLLVEAYHTYKIKIPNKIIKQLE